MTAPGLTPLPPKEAIRFFESKGLKPGFAWQDVWRDEHAQAFTVAKMMQVDMLADVQASLKAALADGTTFADWKKTVQPMLQARGWWGRSQMSDPLTGEVKSVQLGSPRRLRIIYDTNMRMSRAAGAWERIQERKAARPYLRYVAVLDEQTREDHRRWHGLILPVDHPFWRTHYPPNGWKCRCTVQQLSPRDLEMQGWKVTPPDELDKTGWKETRDWTNARSGEVVKVPVGVDPGFAYNSGTAARMAEGQRLLAEKLAAAPPEIARRAGAAALKSPAFERFLQTAQAGGRSGWWPLPPPPAAIKALDAAENAVLYLSDETVAEKAKHDLSADEWRLLPEIMADGVAMASKVKGRYAFLHRVGDRHYELIVNRTQKGEKLFVKTFHRIGADDYRNIQKRGWASAG